MSKYARLGASTRVRSLQYIPLLKEDGFEIDISPLFSNGYLQALYSGKNVWPYAFSGYICRLLSLLATRRYDLLWIEYEIFPFFPAFFEQILARLRLPYIVDYYDALFHKYDLHKMPLVRLLLGKKIDKVMKNAALVMCGNDYLARRAEQAGAAKVEIIPTVIDLDRYSTKSRTSVENKPVCIGWIGSPATTRYLYMLEPIMHELHKKHGVVFAAIGADRKIAAMLPIDVVPWTEKSEVESIQKFDIGVMPLADSPWERGKCGYKLIQYMACGLPVVSSPVGINQEIVEHGRTGFHAQNLEEWLELLEILIINHDLRNKMGNAGRKKVESRYSLQVQAPRLKNLLINLNERTD